MMFATYDPSLGVCDEDYCFFGTDAAGASFCCEIDASGFNAITLTGGASSDMVQLHYDGTELDDYGASQGFPVTVYGQGGEDDISGSPASSASYIEYLYGGADHDVIWSHEGMDYLYGQDGDDDLDGGPDDDHVFGGAGNDTVDGGVGDDVCYGDEGNDTIGGMSGNDQLYCGIGNVDIDGGDGSDELYGQSGTDSLEGGDGSDSLHGGDDADTVCGGGDADLLYGDQGNDQLWDDNIADELNRGAGTGDTCTDAHIIIDACETETSYGYPCP